MSWSLWFTGNSQQLSKELSKIADAVEQTGYELANLDGNVNVSLSGHFDANNSNVARSVSKVLPPPTPPTDNDEPVAAPTPSS